MPALLRGLVMAGLAATLFAVPVWADAPDVSLRPKPRPVVQKAGETLALNAVPMAAVAVPAAMSVRPRPRPAGLAEPGPVPEAAVAPDLVLGTAEVDAVGLLSVIHPARRPDDLAQRMMASASTSPPAAKGKTKTKTKEPAVSRKGSVCGDPAIKGEAMAPIVSKVHGCGIESPVRVTSVAGIALSTPATINCGTAKALKTWITKGLNPVYGKGKVVQLTIFGTYSCRSRNSQRGAKISEHGRGNAVDIGGLVFSNGKSVSVLQNYDSKMRKVHKASCGIFGTTLGPHSDGFHENHLHFDTARYSYGPYCR